MIQYSTFQESYHVPAKLWERIELVTNVECLPTSFLFPLSRLKKANMVVQLAKLKASVLIQPVARLAPRQDVPSSFLHLILVKAVTSATRLLENN